MTEKAKHWPVTIDLNQFKLHIDLKKKIELTLHFNSPSRRFYLSVIAFLVNEMKRLGKITSIPLEENYDLLVLLNDTVGGSAGSSEKENLLPRIYRKWKDALPNLEEAPLFKVLGRKKKYEEEGAGKAYPFTEAEKDNWANLFEYIGSEDKVRLKFALDKIGAGLDDVAIIYESSVNGDAWDRFLSSLEKKAEKIPEIKPIQPLPEVPEPPVSVPKEQGIGLLGRYRWMVPVAMVAIFVGVATWLLWELSLKPASVKNASLERRAYLLPDQPSIAVLPFVNMSDDPQQEYFSDGMTEDLITDLSKVSGLFVIARNSTFLYKGKSVKIQQVAEELGVRYVLEGSVRRAGDQLRINAQLTDASTGLHLWAERYDGSMQDVFSLQDKINQKIVAALAVKLTTQEKALVSQKGTHDPVAYEEFLKGWEHFLKSTKADFVKAEAFFTRAIKLDPNYSRAKAALALLYLNVTDLAGHEAFKISYPEARLRTRKYLMEAMKQPTSTAYAVAASMEINLRQHDEAISLLEKALALEPNDQSVHSAMSWVLSLSGRPEEGMKHAENAMRLDPLNPARHLVRKAFAHLCKGEWQEAATLSEQALKLNPELRLAIPILVSAYVHLGRMEEAKAAVVTYRRGAISPTLPSAQVYMYFYPFKYREVANSFVQSLKKVGIVHPESEYVHVSKEEQITGEDLKSFVYPSKLFGVNPDGSEYSQEFAKDGTATFRSPHLSARVDTGKSWLEGDKIWTQYPELNFGMASCRTYFKNPTGTQAAKNEYIVFTDVVATPFWKAQ